MKNLLYKEFKIGISRTVYLLLFICGCFTLIPSFPDCAALMYLISIYPMIFLGANKGTNNNDVYFSLTLPVARKKIVLARVISVMVIQIITLLIISALAPLGNFYEQKLIANEIANSGKDPSQAALLIVGLPYEGFLSTVSFLMIALTVMDLIFMPLFYKGARAFAIPMVCSIIPYIIVLTIFNIVLPQAVPAYREFFGTWNVSIQLITFFIGITIYLLGHYLTYLFSAKLFEKVDF